MLAWIGFLFGSDEGMCRPEVERWVYVSNIRFNEQ
jgi:hypothetical protein